MRKKKTDAEIHLMEKTVSVLSSIQERAKEPTRAVNNQEENEDWIFAKYIMNELKKIPEGRAKAMLKLKIQNLIFETQYQEPAVSNRTIP